MGTHVRLWAALLLLASIREDSSAALSGGGSGAATASVAVADLGPSTGFRGSTTGAQASTSGDSSTTCLAVSNGDTLVDYRVNPVLLPGHKTAVLNYAYGQGFNLSYNGSPDPQPQQLMIFVTRDYSDELALTVVASAPNNDALGRLRMNVTFTWSAVFIGNTTVLRIDDPQDLRNFTGGTTLELAFEWSQCCTDGFVFGPLRFPAPGSAVTLRAFATQGLDSGAFVSQNPDGTMTRVPLPAFDTADIVIGCPNASGSLGPTAGSTVSASSGSTASQPPTTSMLFDPVDSTDCCSDQFVIAGTDGEPLFTVDADSRTCQCSGVHQALGGAVIGGQGTAMRSRRFLLHQIGAVGNENTTVGTVTQQVSWGMTYPDPAKLTFTTTASSSGVSSAVFVLSVSSPGPTGGTLSVFRVDRLGAGWNDTGLVANIAITESF